MSFLGLALGILGVWRVTHLLHVWVAAPCAWLVGATWQDRALLWPALSAGAMVLNRMVVRLGPPPVATYVEDPEDLTDVQLRTEAGEHRHTN